MDRPTPAADGPALPAWAWLAGVLALFAWQGVMTLSLFGDDPFEKMLNDEPIVSGMHPQKLYIGALGARAVTTHGRTTVYDHRYQVGWLKTPIFDGSRLAELFLVLGGGSYQPAAYKVGFAVVCFLVPVFLLVACKTVCVGHGTSLLATFLGQLVWWGPHGRSAMMSGDCELYLASLTALAHVGFLLAYHRTTSVWSWFGLWITGCLAWFLQPLLFPIALPVLLAYYLSVGAKHDFLTWHVAFWGAEFLSVVVNLPWLIDWLDSWWLRTPLPISEDLLAHRTIGTVWNAPVWGGATSRTLAIFVLLSSVIGVLILNQTRERPTARLLGASAGGAFVLAMLGISWEPLGIVGTAALLAPALWFACIPAAHAWVWTAKWLWGHGWLARFVHAALCVASACGFYLLIDSPVAIVERFGPGEPLEIGLSAERRAIVQALIDATTDDARILWEDRHRSRQASRWPALLPTLTGRCYIGGLDPDGFIEHSSISLMNEKLEDKSIADPNFWDDQKLADYCRRYNVRWVAAWSPAAIKRFADWPAARKRAEFVDTGVGCLFEIDRRSNIALKGQAELVEANGRYITLQNVVPHHGEVVISLHYHAGMRASLPRVQVEPEVSGQDPINFVRLRLAAEAKRVTLSWER